MVETPTYHYISFWSPCNVSLGDPDSGKLDLETHRLALAIAKKTLDENRSTATQKTLARENQLFKLEIMFTLRINNLVNGI